MQRLEHLLARNLGCSRKQARALLDAEGKHLPATIPEEALPFGVRLGERDLVLHDAFHLMLHKPIGCVTALSDRQHPTAASYVRQAPLASELRPVGRLDLDTSGLLLWTTDGEWLHRLTHPRHALPRTYHVALARPCAPLPPSLVLRDGHQPRVLDLAPAKLEAMHPSLARVEGARAYATIRIAGGAYHEVRRIFAALGSHVLALCRVSFGNLTLPVDLTRGQWRPIDKESVGVG